ncbi:MAG: 23S rRNA (adenine(2030)-N(6))-methyltransferase RlmJ [Alphaproteobacteria bacterium]
MLSYRHQFHAGGVADVFKHVMLSRLLLALAKKDKPFFMLDTHAGNGIYDLAHPWSEKTAEWRDGIGRIWGRDDWPEGLGAYRAAIQAINPEGGLRRYPGSPRIAHFLMRPQDRLALCELNKDDCKALERSLAGAQQTIIRNTDGFAAVRPFLPPKERRGLTFIDAAFDQAQEFDRVLGAVKEAHRRFATGMIVVWHPLMDPDAMREFTTNVQGLDIKKTLRLELSTRPETWTETTRGSGMIVISPPYQFDEEAPLLLDWIWRALSPEGTGGVRCDWLVPE